MSYLRFFFVAAAYLLSGAVILKCLSRLKMRVGCAAFSVLLFVGSLYIPIVCGTGAMRVLLEHCLSMRADADTFVDRMSSPSYSLVPFFSVVTLLFIVFAAILLVALLIVAVILVRHIVRSFRRTPREGFRRKRIGVRFCPYLPKTRKIYLEFCRLLN